MADDKAGNLFYRSFTITIDNPPVLAAKLLRDTAPLGRTNTDGYTSDPTIVGSATDRNGVVVVRARFANQPTLVNITPQVKPTDGSFTLNRTQLETIYGGVLPEGQQTLLLQTQDGTGNLSEKTVTFTLDTVAPLLTLTSVANQAALSSGVRLVGSVVEAGSTAMLSYRFDRLAAVELKTTNGSFSQGISFAGVSNGSHTLTLTGVDQAGNASTITLNVTVNLPTPIAPAITVNLSRDTAIDGGTNTDRWTADPTITAQIDRTQIMTVQVGLDNMPEAAFVDVTDRLTAQGGLTLTRAQIEALIGQPLAEGTHTIYVQGKDTQGLRVTQDLTFVLDTTLPVLTFDQPYYSTQETNPTISGETEPGAVIRLYRGTQLLGTATADAAGFWELATGVLTEGANALTAKAIDRAGNVGVTQPISVTIDHQPPAAPTELKLAEGYDTGKSRSDSSTRVSNPIVTGKAEPRSWVQVFRSGVLVGETITAEDGTWRVEVATLPEGISDLSAIATDEAGNVGAVSGLLRLTIDLTPPAAPTGLTLVAASDSGISATDRLTNAVNPTIAGRAEPNLLVQLFDGNRFLGQAIADGLGNWQVTAPQLADGLHTLSARAFDPVANRSALSLPLQVTIDATGPDLSLTSLYANGLWAAGDPLVGTVTNAGVPVNSMSYQIFAATNLTAPLVSQSVSVNAQGGFNAPLNLGSLVTGTPYVFVATAMDAAGNTTTKSLNFQRATTVTLPPIPAGSSSILSYPNRLDTMLTEAGLALSGNRQVGLNQAQNSLNQIGTLVAAGGFQAGMAGVLQGLYALANQPMTEAQAKTAGRALASTLMSSDVPVATQVMQAKLLAAAFAVPELRGALPTGAGDTPLSLALKELAVSYLATRSDPTVTLVNRADMPNLLSLIGSAATQSELSQAALRLGTALRGTEAPDQAVRMVERLLRVAQATGSVQGSLGDEAVSGGLVDLGFAYGRLNPTPVTNTAQLAQLPFQQLWQATDAAGVQAAQPGIEAFFAGYSGIREQRTLVQNQAYLLDQVKGQGLLSVQELRDPTQIQNLLAAGTFMFAPQLPTDTTGGSGAGLVPGVGAPANPNSVLPTAGTAVPMANAAPAASSGGSGFTPAMPGLGGVPGAVPSSLAQVPMNILGDRFYNPDGTPKPSSELLTWQVDVPVHFTLLPFFFPETRFLRPNSMHRFWVESYGGVQVKQVLDNSMITRWPYADNRQWVVYTALNSNGELVTGRSDINTGLWDFWEPEFGLGTVTLVPRVRPPLSGEAQLSGGLEGAGGLAPNAGDPEWSPSPAPQPGAPGSRPMPPGTELQPLPNGGTAPVQPGGFLGPNNPNPSNPLDPTNPNGSNGSQNPEDGPIFPEGNGDGGGGTPPGKKKPISEMSLIEAFWTAISRTPELLVKDLQDAAKELLSNPYLQDFLKLVLILAILFPEFFAGLMGAIELGMLGLGMADFIKGVMHVFQAKMSNSDALLDQASHDFAHAIENLGPAMLSRVGELVQGLKIATGRLKGFPVLNSLFLVLDTLRLDFVWQALRAGKIGEILKFGDKLAALTPEARAALGAVSKNPVVLGKILEEGPQSISDLNTAVAQYGMTSEMLADFLGKQGRTIVELKEMLLKYSNEGKSIEEAKDIVRNIDSSVFVKDSKFDYFFGRVTSSPENQARSLQNLKDLNKLGIDEAKGGRKRLIEIFEEGLNKPEKVNPRIDQNGVTITREVEIVNGDVRGAIVIRYLYRGGDLSSKPEITSIIPKIYN